MVLPLSFGAFLKSFRCSSDSFYKDCPLCVWPLPTIFHSQPHQLINSSAHKVKLIFFYFTIPLRISLYSSENIGHKVGKYSLFITSRVFGFVYFQEQNLHFAPFSLSSLVVNSKFQKPNYPLLAPKNPLFTAHFALFSHVFHGSKGFYLYHRDVYLCLSPCIQQHFALRLAPKRIAFSIKTACVQHQNGLHLAPKCTAFSTKTH